MKKSSFEVVKVPCLDHAYLIEQGTAVVEVLPEHLHEIRIFDVNTGWQIVQVRESVCVEVHP